MKIVKRIDFVKLPSNTLFSEYAPCYFGPLLIKGDTLPSGNDWYEQQIADAVAAHDSGEWADKLFDAAENGTSIGMDFDMEGRDGCFDPDDRLYAVWEPQDVQHLVNRLQRCLASPLETPAEACEAIAISSDPDFRCVHCGRPNSAHKNQSTPANRQGKA